MFRALLQTRPEAGSCVLPAGAGHDLWLKYRPFKRLSLTHSCPWMEPIVDRAHPRLEHMRVDLRGRQVSVAEHHLDGAEIGAAVEEVRRERMTHDVRAERPWQARLAPVAFEDL